MKCIIASILVLFSFFTNAFAIDKGNGGDIVICPGTASLLDAVEFKKPFDLPGAGLRNMVFNKLELLETVDSWRARQLKNFAKDLLSAFYDNGEPIPNAKHVLFTEDELNDINDSHELTIPANCIKKQLVIQKSFGDVWFPEGYTYIINTKLWKLLDLKNKALTILHEVWYRSNIGWGAKDSRFSRRLNMYLASTYRPTLKSYFELLRKGQESGEVVWYTIGSLENPIFHFKAKSIYGDEWPGPTQGFPGTYLQNVNFSSPQQSIYFSEELFHSHGYKYLIMNLTDGDKIDIRAEVRGRIQFKNGYVDPGPYDAEVQINMDGTVRSVTDNSPSNDRRSFRTFVFNGTKYKKVTSVIFSQTGEVIGFN